MEQAKAHAGSLRQFLEFADVCSIPLKDIVGPELLAAIRSCGALEYVDGFALVDILQLCGTFLGRSDLGVSFANWASFRGYGPFSLLWDYCSDLHDVVRICRKYVHLENEILATGLDRTGRHPILTQMLTQPTRYGGAQYIEFTVAIQVRHISTLLGPDWAPVRVQFSHTGQGPTAQHRNVFRCPVQFDAEVSGIVVSASDFTIRVPRHNPSLLAYLEGNLSVQAATRDDGGLIQQAKMIVAGQLRQGQVSVEQVADQLSMSKRSFQRRLSQNGTSFSQLLIEVRRTTALEFLRTDRRPSLGVLAQRLGFSEASAASRFLRLHCERGLRGTGHEPSGVVGTPAPD